MQRQRFNICLFTETGANEASYGSSTRTSGIEFVLQRMTKGHEQRVLGGKAMSELYTLGLGFVLGIGTVVAIFTLARK